MRSRSATAGAPEIPVQVQDQSPAGLVAGLPREGEPVVPGPWARIVRHVYSIDVDAAWSDVIKAEDEYRKRPPSQREYGELIDDLAEAARIQEILIQLVPNADLVFDRYEADVETLSSDMRAQSRAALEVEKSEFEAMDEKEKGKGKGSKGKQITDADVKARMAGSFPDAYARQQEMLAKAKGSRDFMERMRDSWGSRRREIEGIIRTTRAQ